MTRFPSELGLPRETPPARVPSSPVSPTLYRDRTAPEDRNHQQIGNKELASGCWFAAAAISLVVTAAAIAGWAPLGFSVVTVFLFAGPHNWLEARYLLQRMPPKWGKLRGYFLTGIGGVLVLTAAYWVLPGVASWAGSASWIGTTEQTQQPDAEAEVWYCLQASWNTFFVGWVLLLVRLRSRHNPKRNWDWTLPVGVGLLWAAWMAPMGFALSLVYLHPLMALWFLDRELARRRAYSGQTHWHSCYRAVLLSVPVVLGVLWWRLAGTGDLPADDPLGWRITNHAGAGILGLNSHLLVATHTFLEMLHYGVWVLALPLATFPENLWRIDQVPLARRSPRWRAAVGAVLMLGLCLVLVFWVGFVIDYPRTRDLYFTIAMLHVLAEVPFLLRLL